MAKYQILALTNPVAGREAEFNHWYTHTHLGDVQRFPGVTSGKRFELVKSQGTACKYRYLAVYEVETDLSADEFATRLLATAGTDQMFMSPAFDFEDFQMLTFEPIP